MARRPAGSEGFSHEFSFHHLTALHLHAAGRAIASTMSARRWQNSAVTLLTGKVLVVGGACGIGAATCNGDTTVADLFDPAWLYFVHSYAPEPTDTSVVACWCDYGRRFAAAIERGPLWATQFHPENSGAGGLKLMQNFVDACARVHASH